MLLTSTLVLLLIPMILAVSPVGTWKNELGSTMKLNILKGNILVGEYISLVGNVNGTYALIGLYDSTNSLLGWTVSFDLSLVSWAGQHVDDNHIIATWVLTSQVSQVQDHWKSTTIGTNTFIKIK